VYSIVDVDKIIESKLSIPLWVPQFVTRL